MVIQENLVIVKLFAFATFKMLVHFSTDWGSQSVRELKFRPTKVFFLPV